MPSTDPLTTSLLTGRRGLKHSPSEAGNAESRKTQTTARGQLAKRVDFAEGPANETVP
jgi:hypothetical protein